MTALDAPTAALTRRTIAVGSVTYYDGRGGHRFAHRGDDIDLVPGAEVRLETQGALLPNRPPRIGHSSANRPGRNDMIELAKLELARGRRDRALRVLDAEQLLPREARPELLEELSRLLGVAPRPEVLEEFRRLGIAYGPASASPDEFLRVMPWQTVAYARKRADESRQKGMGLDD